MYEPGIRKSQGRRYPGNYQQSDVSCNSGDAISEIQHGVRLVLRYLSTPEWDEREDFAQQRAKQQASKKGKAGVCGTAGAKESTL